MKMMKFSPAQRLRHVLIRSRWRLWLAPSLCAVPYTLSLVWLLQRGQTWIVQIMITPLLMMCLLGLVTWVLACLEFRLKGKAWPWSR